MTTGATWMVKSDFEQEYLIDFFATVTLVPFVFQERVFHAHKDIK